MKKQCIGAVCLALLVSGVLSAEAMADTVRKSITPLLNASAQYDSNFFKTETDEEEVYTYLVQPGIEIATETERSHLSLYYTLDAYYYDEDVDADLDFIGHTLKFDAGTKSRSKKLSLNFKDDYRRSRNPDYRDYLTSSVSRAEYGINRARPELQYQLGNVRLGLAYENVLIKYDDTDVAANEDSTQNMGIGTINYLLDRYNMIGVTGRYWKMDYDKTTVDYDAWQAMATYNRRGKYFSLNVGAGYQKREYDHTLADIDGFIGRIGLGGSRNNTKFSINLDHNLNVDGVGDQYYTTTKLALELAHTLMNSGLKFGLKGRLQNSDYENNSREDDTWGVEGSLEYPLFRWLTLHCGAGYEERDSDAAGNDYDNFYGLVMFRFSKPIGTGEPVISQ